MKPAAGPGPTYEGAEADCEPDQVREGEEVKSVKDPDAGGLRVRAQAAGARHASAGQRGQFLSGRWRKKQPFSEQAGEEADATSVSNGRGYCSVNGNVGGQGPRIGGC